ncbi:MAG: hypothetical protein ACSLFN_12415 [Candidatus Limnocylindrales bacterium]
MAVTVARGVVDGVPLVEQLTNVGSMAAFAFVGLVVLWQRPGHGIGRLALAIALMFAVSTLLGTGIEVLNPRWGFARVLRSVADIVSTTLFSLATIGGGLILAVWFPDGRRTSRLGLIVEALVVLVVVASVISSVGEDVAKRLGLPDVAFAVIEAMQAGFALIVLAFGLATLDLVIRYRRSDPLRRTQIRWVLAASMGTILSVVLVAVAGESVPGLWNLLGVSLTLPAYAIAIAISRYHLYDIDRIVSRTIAYGLVTAVLFALFLGSNLVLQGLLTSATGANPLAVAISTLVVAVMFQPFRRRVQDLVDRRFHRARYDAQRTVDGFAARLRGQVDLPTLAGELRATTVDAVEPVSTTVWIRPVSGAP